MWKRCECKVNSCQFSTEKFFAPYSKSYKAPTGRRETCWLFKRSQKYGEVCDRWILTNPGCGANVYCKLVDLISVPLSTLNYWQPCCLQYHFFWNIQIQHLFSTIDYWLAFAGGCSYHCFWSCFCTWKTSETQTWWNRKSDKWDTFCYLEMY